MAKKKYKVLLVEDEEIMAGHYKRQFEKDGFDVVLATDGQEAIDQAKNNKFDLVILDVILPLRDGFTVLTELRSTREYKDKPIIMLSALGTNDDKVKGKSLGASEYLAKPFYTPAQVSDVVKNHLDKQHGAF